MDLDWLFSDDSDCEIEPETKKRKTGRPALEEKHPEVIGMITEFLKQNTAAAHLRRRDSTLYTSGVTLQEIVDHLKSKGINTNRNSVHRLMKPVRNGTIASKRFKSLVDARVPPKNNGGERETHPDFHYTCSQIGMANEMASLCPTGTLQLSVDNKNKVDVGIVAVNRRCKINRFHLRNDYLVYNDHDFPYRNSKLTPAGYQVLRPRMRSRSLSPKRVNKQRVRRRRLSSCAKLPGTVKVTTDKLGRDKVVWSREGPLTVEVYPSRAIEATNTMHVRHLEKMIKNDFFNGEIFNIVMIADGGPDWSVKGVVNFMSMGLFWLKSKLDILLVQCYAPGHSRFNPIERSWSFLTKWLVGVTLPTDANGGKVPKDDDDEGWNTVLDNAAEVCTKFWHGRRVNGHKINAFPFLTSNPDIESLKRHHQTIHSFAKASAKQLRDGSDEKLLQKVYQLLVTHCNRKPYQLEFVRCSRPLCNHCMSLPKRNNPLLDLVDEFGGSFPSPTESFIHRGHFENFVETFQQLSFKAKHSDISKHGQCPYGCNYTFFSDADRKRHIRLMGHNKKP